MLQRKPQEGRGVRLQLGLFSSAVLGPHNCLSRGQEVTRFRPQAGCQLHMVKSTK
jgi:hypothetical protein